MLSYKLKHKVKALFINQLFTSVDALEIASHGKETIMTKHALIHVGIRKVYIKFTSTRALSSSFLHKIIRRNTQELPHAKQYGKSFIKIKKKPTKVATDMSDKLMVGRHTLPIHHLTLFGYAMSLLFLGTIRYMKLDTQ